MGYGGERGVGVKERGGDEWEGVVEGRKEGSKQGVDGEGRKTGREDGGKGLLFVPRVC